MKRKPFNEIIDKVLDNCVEECEVGVEDRFDYTPVTNYFGIEEDGYAISGSYEIVGTHSSSGDGYWDPIAVTLSNVEVVKVEVDEAFWYDPETDDYLELPQSEIDELVKQIKNCIPEAVEG